MKTANLESAVEQGVMLLSKGQLAKAKRYGADMLAYSYDSRDTWNLHSSETGEIIFFVMRNLARTKLWLNPE